MEWVIVELKFILFMVGLVIWFAVAGFVLWHIVYFLGYTLPNYVKKLLLKKSDEKK